MKLFYFPGACSLGPHIVINEAGLEVALDKVSFAAERRTESGENYYEVTPQGAVPVLQLDTGERLTEAQVIMQYLASLAPQANLAPAEGMAHWRLLETLNFIATELHKGASPLFRNPAPEARIGVVANLQNRYKLLAGKLGDKPYLLGDAFSIADAYAYVVLNWARTFDVATPAPLPAYFERIRARPGVQKTLREEGLPTA